MTRMVDSLHEPIPPYVSQADFNRETAKRHEKRRPRGAFFQSWQSLALPEGLVVADAHVRSFPLVEALRKEALAGLVQNRSAQVSSTTSPKLVHLHGILPRNRVDQRRSCA
jgi:hypothetical protein